MAFYNRFNELDDISDAENISISSNEEDFDNDEDEDEIHVGVANKRNRVKEKKRKENKNIKLMNTNAKILRDNPESKHGFIIERSGNRLLVKSVAKGAYQFVMSGNKKSKLVEGCEIVGFDNWSSGLIKEDGKYKMGRSMVDYLHN